MDEQCALRLRNSCEELRKLTAIVGNDCVQRNLISVSSAAFFHHFCMHLGPSSQILCRPLFCLINLYRLQGSGTLKTRKATKWGFKCHKISPDFVITNARPHYYSLSLSQAKNFQISIRLRYIRSLCSNLPTIFRVCVLRT